VIFEGRKITFTKDFKFYTIFINKIINDGVVKMFCYSILFPLIFFFNFFLKLYINKLNIINISILFVFVGKCCVLLQIIIVILVSRMI
jgi:hypothetical protein